VSEALSIMMKFLTSGRPTRSCRALYEPRVIVSATIPMSGPASGPNNAALSVSTTRLNTFWPATELMLVGSGIFRFILSPPEKSWSTKKVSNRQPAKTRVAPELDPASSPTLTSISPHGVRQVPTCTTLPPSKFCGTSKVKLNVCSSLPTANAAVRPVDAMRTERSRIRYSIASENRVNADGLKGHAFSTMTRFPGRSGLGNAQRSEMSISGFAVERGPAPWSAMIVSPGMDRGA
jgi:hypothetical protein